MILGDGITSDEDTDSTLPKVGTYQCMNTIIGS